MYGVGLRSPDAAIGSLDDSPCLVIKTVYIFYNFPFFTTSFLLTGSDSMETSCVPFSNV